MSYSSSPIGKSPSPPINGGGGRGGGGIVDSFEGVLVTRPSPRQFVSLLTCSKLCGLCFVAGIVVGFTLKRRVRRWASKLLRRIRDD